MISNKHLIFFTDLKLYHGRGVLHEKLQKEVSNGIELLVLFLV